MILVRSRSGPGAFMLFDASMWYLWIPSYTKVGEILICADAKGLGLPGSCDCFPEHNLTSTTPLDAYVAGVWSSMRVAFEMF